MIYQNITKSKHISLENLASPPHLDTPKKMSLSKLSIQSLEAAVAPKAAQSMPNIQIAEATPLTADYSEVKSVDEVDYLGLLAAAGQSWLDMPDLFSKRRTLGMVDVVEEARNAFCRALGSLCKEETSRIPPQDSTHESPHTSHVTLPTSTKRTSSPTSVLSLSPAPLSTGLQSDPADTAPGPSNRSEANAPRETMNTSPSGLSYDDLQLEFDKFSFHTSDEEEWTSEVEERKQNQFNRQLSDMKRSLNDPVPKLSKYFSEDSLAECAKRDGLGEADGDAVEVELDSSSAYSADDEDWSSEVEGVDESLVTTASEPSSCSLDSPTDLPAVLEPTPSSPLALLAPTQPEVSDADNDEGGTHEHARERAIDVGPSDVWKSLATHVRTLLSRISEESLADEYEIEATAQAPPVSFKRPSPPYKRSARVEICNDKRVWEIVEQSLVGFVPMLLTRISEESLADEYEIEADAQLPPPSFRRPSPPSRISAPIKRADDADEVEKSLAVFVPRLLTRISEESLADEYEIEDIANRPPSPFQRPRPQFRRSQYMAERTRRLEELDRLRSPVSISAGDLVDVADEAEQLSPTKTVDTESSGDSSSVSDTSFATTVVAEDSPRSSVEVKQRRSLRRIGKFVDLRNSVGLPTAGSASSVETLYETIVPEESQIPAKAQGRSLRRVVKCLNLRKPFAPSPARVTAEDDQAPSHNVISRPLRRVSRCENLKETYVPLFKKTEKITPPPSSPSPKDPQDATAKPAIPPKPAGLRMPRAFIQPSTTAHTQNPLQEPPRLRTQRDPLSSIPLWSCAKITRSQEKRAARRMEERKTDKKRFLDPVRKVP
ncbi:hypothetical protein HYDPIDRAFT_165043 [Hydnomerulius pinastri MD-312]|nr:hypothetical protein HYDPIDRAFT_165043 [Hydnomerulius pinastri MD-312]